MDRRGLGAVGQVGRQGTEHHPPLLHLRVFQPLKYHVNGGQVPTVTGKSKDALKISEKGKQIVWKLL